MGQIASVPIRSELVTFSLNIDKINMLGLTPYPSGRILSPNDNSR